MRPRIKPTDVLPEELTRSAPRPIALTSLGTVAVTSMIALVVGAVLSGILLYQRIVSDADPVRMLQTEGKTSEARVIDVERRRGDGARAILSYSYAVDGHEYGGQTRLRKGDRHVYSIGSRVQVRYLASNPAASWMADYMPRATPYWLIVAVPGGLLLCIAPLLIVMRRQSELLQNGRAALARVTKTQRVSYTAEHKTWRIYYEWNLVSGAIRTGHCDRNKKNPPAIGSTIPIMYHGDNPRHHSVYPLSLVRVAKR